MTVKNYEINFSKSVRDFVIDYPNRLNLIINNGSLIFSIDHPNLNDELNFQNELSKRMGIKSESSFLNTGKFLDEIKTDLPLLTMTPRLQITNLPTIYTDLFPALYNGFPIPIHTIGYAKMGFVLLWNKNGGTSNHDVRLVKCDSTGALLPNSSTPDVLVQGTNVISGRTTNFDFAIPATFLNYRGFVKIQGKSVNGTDDPILDALFIYLIRE